MPSRWTILAVLFLARFAMAVQFQSTAALSPFLIEGYGASLADIGLLIGLYLAPGLVVALPGGAIAAWFGDVRVVAVSMAAMLAGGALAALAPGWEAALAGRLVAGIGGVIINVVLTKMLVDWFAGREISTALGIFVVSWPAGIALALLVLPPLADAAGLGAARAVVLGLVAVGLGAYLAIYRPAPGASAPAAHFTVRQIPAGPLIAAGLVWALYNAALAMVFSFGAPALAEAGWSMTEASALTSAFMAAFAIFLPLGGLIADRTGRRDLVIAASLLGYAALLPLAALLSPVPSAGVLIAAGIVFGLAAGPIMALPSEVLAPEARAFGMGVFFTIYYVVMTVAPGLAGAVAERSGSAGSAFALSVALSLAAAGALVVFRRGARRNPAIA